MTSQPSLDENVATFDRRGFRNALASFPTGVTVISTRGEQGALVGLTANSFTSVSLEPPLVQFSLVRRSPSLSAFERSGVFAVSVLTIDQAALSNKFATPAEDKWRGVDYVIGEASGCPVIAGALAAFECKTHAFHDGGDHVIIVGYVLRFERLTVGEPLLFYRGSYRAMTSDNEFPDYATPNGPRIVPPLNGFDPWTAG
jgi:flavin reductase (DIM6/NTAB) family NADH-FMN oxidoreductase RutF